MPADIECLCCGRFLPPSQYRTPAALCALCASNSVYDVALMTSATVTRKLSQFNSTKEARLQARRQARQSAYAVHGKRCCTCWHGKPITAYSVCNTRGDGLQPDCNACRKLYSSMLHLDGGRAMFKQVRDTMRAQPGAIQLAAK